MNDPAPSTPETPAQTTAPATSVPTKTGSGAAFAWLVCLLALGFGFAQVYPMLADGLTADERVNVQIQEAQAQRVQRGLKPLVLAFDLRGDVIAVESGAITVWGTAVPVDLPNDRKLADVDGWTLDRATLIVRSVDPKTVTVGRGSQARAYFVERRAAPGRVGQPPVWEFVYDMDETAALLRLREHAGRD